MVSKGQLIMTSAEFLSLGFTRWKEIHWTMAQNWEQVEIICKRMELPFENAHRMCFPTNVKGSDGFYGYWIGIRDE